MTPANKPTNGWPDLLVDLARLLVVGLVVAAAAWAIRHFA